MSADRIANRYAKSLIDLAVEQGKLEEVHNDVKYIEKVAENKDFQSVIKSPVIAPAKKKQVLNALFSGKVSPMMSSFLKTVLSKGREAYLGEMAKDFIVQYKTIKKVSAVQLTSAQPLSKATVDKILAKLHSSSSTMDNIELDIKVDPSLIGGFVLQYNDKLYDTSVKHKLSLLKKEFNKNQYIKNI